MTAFSKYCAMDDTIQVVVMLHLHISPFIIFFSRVAASASRHLCTPLPRLRGYRERHLSPCTGIAGENDHHKQLPSLRMVQYSAAHEDESPC